MNLMFQGVKIFEGSESAVKKRLETEVSSEELNCSAYFFYKNQERTSVGYLLTGEDARVVLRDSFEIDIPAEYVQLSRKEILASPEKVDFLMSLVPRMQALFDDSKFDETLQKIADYAKQCLARGQDAEGKPVVQENV